jgi:hypothetical protein
VFINRPHTIHKLKAAIEREIAAILPRHANAFIEQLKDEVTRMRTKRGLLEMLEFNSFNKRGKLNKFEGLHNLICLTSS